MTDQLNKHASAKLVAKMTERSSTLTKSEAELAVARVFDALTEVVKEHPFIRISNFGTFKRTFSEGRTGRNPRTGETITIGGTYKIRFKQGKGV